MASSLHLLASSTIRSIASSQVITSVSCVVKELVENSLDAGATNIEVKLGGWGLEKIEVRDNGSGVSTEDIPFVGQAHYTSKLNTDKDLETLMTYGFRGEALGALCALSNVTFTTKTASDSVAMCYTLDCSGKVVASKPAPASCGTAVTACNLFKSMPVRKQFYGNSKKCKEEFKKVEDLVIAFALIQPQLRILLRHNKSVVWQKSKVTNHRTALISVLGASVFSQMEQLHLVDQQGDCCLEILGYLPKVGADSNMTSRVSSDRCFIYVNERPVVFKQVLQLVKQYYNGTVQSSTNRYPIMFLSLKVPPNAVDVNLEPNKYTVLLKDNEDVLRVVTELLEQHYSKGKENICEDSANDQGPKHSEPGFSVVKKSDNNSGTDFTCAKDTCMLHSHVSIGCNSVLTCSVNTDRNGSCKENTQDATAPGEELNNNLIGNNSTNAVPSDSETGQNSIKTPQELVNHDSTANCNSLQSCSKQKVVEEPSYDDWADGLFNDSFDIDFSIPSTSSTCASKATMFKPRLVNDAKTVSDSTVTAGLLSASDAQFESSQLAALNERSALPLASTGKEPSGLQVNTYVSDSTDTAGLLSASDAQFEFSQLAALNERSSLPLSSTGKEPSDKQENTSDNKKEQSQTPSLLNNKASDQEKNVDGALTCEHLLDISDLDSLEAEDILCGTALSDVTRKNTDGVSCEGNMKEPAIEDWSRGHSIVDKQGKPLEPVQLLLPPAAPRVSPEQKRSSLSIKRKHSYSGHSSSNVSERATAPTPSKKIRKVAQVVNQPLITARLKPAPSPEERMQSAPKAEVHFSMLELKETYCNKKSNRSSKGDSCPQLICRLDPWGVWLMRQSDRIECVNQYRIQEQVLFHRLMGSYSFQREQLERSIPLNESLVGGAEAFSVLCSMEHQTVPPDPVSCIVDKRLIANGFDVRRRTDPESGEVRLELYGMTSDLPFYGVSDLAQLVGMIKSAGNADNCDALSQCRPLKALSFLEGEAVRLARKLAARMTKEEIKEILRRMHQTLPDRTTSCIHGHPFFHTIANIPNILK